VFLVVLIVICVACGFIGREIGSDRGRDDGFLWGFLLGPLGLLILYLGPNPKKEREERESRYYEQRRAEERHQSQIAEMRALIDKLTPKESANSPKVLDQKAERPNESVNSPIDVPNIIDHEAERYWVKLSEKDKEHGPMARQYLRYLFEAKKITFDTLVARDHGELPREFRKLGEDISALKMPSGSDPLEPPKAG
jgi:hypothetical protein